MKVLTEESRQVPFPDSDDEDFFSARSEYDVAPVQCEDKALESSVDAVASPIVLKTVVPAEEHIEAESPATVVEETLDTEPIAMEEIAIEMDSIDEEAIEEDSICEVEDVEPANEEEIAEVEAVADSNEQPESPAHSEASSYESESESQEPQMDAEQSPMEPRKSITEDVSMDEQSESESSLENANENQSVEVSCSDAGDNFAQDEISNDDNGTSRLSLPDQVSEVQVEIFGC